MWSKGKQRDELRGAAGRPSAAFDDLLVDLDEEAAEETDFHLHVGSVAPGLRDASPFAVVAPENDPAGGLSPT